MNNLHKIAVIGASLGVSQMIYDMFPEPKPVKEVTKSDVKRMAAAEEKRLRKAEKLKAVTGN